jgi:hypothetical protein
MEQRQSGRVPRLGVRSQEQEKVIHVEPSGHRRFWKDGKPPRYRVRGKHLQPGDRILFASREDAAAHYASRGITVVEAGEA